MKPTLNVHAFFRLAALAAIGLCAPWALANNQQVVRASGGIVNSAVTGGAAVMNISSTKGIPVPPGNRQITDVKGAVINAAGAGGYAELNIASKTPAGSSGSQVISINGPVVNQAFGGRASVMNIGSSR